MQVVTLADRGIPGGWNYPEVRVLELDFPCKIRITPFCHAVLVLGSIPYPYWVVN